MSDEVYPLRWLPVQSDPAMFAEVDERIRRAFTKAGYQEATGDLYLSTNRYGQEEYDDYSVAFFGRAGSVLLCHSCPRGGERLHLHVANANSPAAATDAIYQDVAKVDRTARRYVGLVSWLRESLTVLTGDNKFVLPAAILTLLGSIVGLVRTPLGEGPVVENIITGAFTAVLLLCLVYLLAVLLFAMAVPIVLVASRIHR